MGGEKQALYSNVRRYRRDVHICKASGITAIFPLSSVSIVVSLVLITFSVLFSNTPFDIFNVLDYVYMVISFIVVRLR